MTGKPDQMLSRPAPRPLGPIWKGEALVTAGLGLFASVAGLVSFLVLLAVAVIPLDHTSVLGDTRATLSIIACAGSAALFVGSWVAAVSGLRRVHLYRTGQRGTGTVERVSVKGNGETRTATIHWRLRAHDGQAHGLRTVLEVPRGMDPVTGPAPGAQFAALYPEKRPAMAQPVGVLGLRPEWVLAPALQPPRGFALLRAAAVLLACVVAALAFTGFTVNRTLDPGYLRSWTWAVAGSTAVLCVPVWLVLRRFGPWLPGQTWLWLAASFFVLCMGGLGMASGANVWLDRKEPRLVRARIMHMDEEYFPEWHRAAFVASWREGHVKERIPLYWRTALAVEPGDDLIIEVREGAFGWATVGRATRAP